MIKRNKRFTDAEIIARATDRLSETLAGNSQNEIRSKDRVDISLNEYLGMRDEIDKLKRHVKCTDDLIIAMGIPAEVIDRIDPDSVRVETCDNAFDFKRYYRITFSAEDCPF